ncbi:MAG: HAMP domain-containing histidine kinase [Bacteroidales bacterium]|nr:HAMP domain-containing histidine kinase [Bacteroidales bacterium]
MSKKVFTLLIVVICTLIFSIFYWKSASFNLRDDIEKLQNIINTKISSAEQFLSQIKPCEGNYETFSSFSKNYNIGILIIKNNNPVFWTNNDYISIEYLNLIKTPKILYFNNVWFFSFYKKYNCYTVYFFIPIKKQYYINNKYIKDEYFTDFNLTYDYTFSNIPQENSYEIKDINNNYLFSVALSNNKIKNNTISNAFILYFFAIFLIIIYLTKSNRKNKIIHAFLLSLFLIMFTIFSYFFVSFSTIRDSELFSPQIFSYNNIINSLGVLIVLLLCFIGLSYIFKRNIIITFNYNIYKIITALFFYFISFFFIIFYSESIISNSSLSFNRTYTLMNHYSLLLLLILAIVIIINYNWLFIVLKVLRYLNKRKYFQIIIILNLIFLCLGYILTKNCYVLLFIVPNILLSIFIWFNKYKLLHQTLLFFIVSVVLSIILLKLTEKKERELLLLFLKNKSIERNYSFETDFKNVISIISKDSIVKTLVDREQDNRYEITRYFKMKYFYKYPDFEIRILKCDEKTTLKILPAKNLVPCIKFFTEQINDSKTIKITDNFYFVQNEEGITNYIAFLDIYKSLKPLKKLIIEIYPQNVNERIGYHSVLYSSEYNVYREYNLAKYYKNNLIKKIGKYNFPIILNSQNSSDKPNISNFGNYINVFYKTSNNTVFVASVQFDKLKTVALILIVLFNLLMFIQLIFYLFNFIKGSRFQNKGFRYKYLLSTISILLIAYLLSGMYSFYFIKKNFSDINTKELNDKTNSIINFLKEKYGKLSNIYLTNPYELSSDLITLSNIFYSDVNFYDSVGILFASSRLSLFTNGIKSKLINYEALQNFHINQKIVIKEKIGTLEYFSHYIPFLDGKKIIGILQIPYFTEQEDFNDKIISAFLWLINFYFLLITIFLNVSAIMVRKIFFSLTTLEKYFKNINPDLMYRPLEYKEKDEILTLVKEYNRVLDELKEKTKKLIQSERESTWKDIARQVAHEIKNPLTPMKLHIQHTLKIVQEKKYNTDDIVKTLKSLLEQIDSLASIAESFSIFSKVLTPYIEEIEIVSYLNKIVTIYNTEKEIIKLNSGKISEIYVDADTQYIKQIFNNLITNAIQAIPEDREKNITISLTTVNDILKIEIADNGIGIPEEIKDKIFTPSFSTKTSGMGLGLAITKNMIDLLNGKIYFETQINKGTTFYIELKYKRKYEKI